MELGESEPLSILNDHDTGIGHIDTHFDHGGGHKDASLAAGKPLHLSIFVGRFHLAMHLTDLAVREIAANLSITILEVLEVHLFALLNQGIDNINLTPLIHLHLYFLVDAVTVIVEHVDGVDGFTTRWEFVDDADIQITIEGHGQGTWDGSGGHHENVRRHSTLLPHLGPLCHTKAVLLVDDGQSKAREDHVVLDDGMRADEDMDITILQVVEDGLAFLALHAAREQFDPYGHVAQKLAEGLQVLLGQYFGRCHDASLTAIVDGNERTHQRHKGLARTNVTLQQTVHLATRTHVLAYFLQHTLLRTCQFER